MDDDEDLVVQTRNKRFDKGFGSSNHNGYASRSPAPRDNYELTDILENRNQQMKLDLHHARLQISRNPVKVPKSEDEFEKDDQDTDLAETLKFKKDDPPLKATKQYELKPLDGNDSFDGMDGAPMRKEPSPLPLSRPPLIPNSKTRVKLQPMSLAPIL